MLYCNQIIDGVWLECHGGSDKDDSGDDNNSGDDSTVRTVQTVTLMIHCCR